MVVFAFGLVFVDFKDESLWIVVFEELFELKLEETGDGEAMSLEAGRLMEKHCTTRPSFCTLSQSVRRRSSACHYPC